MDISDFGHGRDPCFSLRLWPLLLAAPQGQQPNKDVGSKLGDWLKSTTPNEEGKVAITDQAADAQKRVAQASEKVRSQRQY